MKKIIHKTFGLRDGEIFISFLMQFYIFIIITVLLIVKPTVNALFVSSLGADNLPYGYLLVALVAVITTYFYNKAIRRFSLIKITVLSLIVFSLFFAALAIVLKFHFFNTFILYFYYVFVSLFAVVATSQFWIFANMVFNTREAKRIFGFIGAGAIAGGIFGGYLTSILASNFGKEYAIFIASILLLICIPVLRKVYTIRIQYLNTFKRKQIIANQDQLERSSLKLILKSKHLSYLALIVGISVIVAKLIDFQFSDFANRAIVDSNKLAAFFGFWFSTFNVVALTIQLFFTNKLLQKLGVSSSLLVLPLCIGLGSLLFLTFPELWVLIIIKGIDGSFKQSLNKAAFELSIMPIPQQIKNQAKSYIDVAVDSIATGLAGFMLLFFIKKLALSTAYITVIIIFFVFVWVVLIYKLREAYFESFKENIQKTLYHIDSSKEKSKKENNVIRIKNVLQSNDETAILNILNRLENYKLEVFKEHIIQLLDHSSYKIKIAAIHCLDAFNDDKSLLKIKHLVFEQNETLVFVVLEYILNHSPITERKFFNTYLDHESIIIANAALLVLAKQSQNNIELRNLYNLNNRLETKINNYSSENERFSEEVIAGLLMSIAYAKLTVHYNFITAYLRSGNAYYTKYATIAAGITADIIFIDDLLHLLTIKKFRKRAIKALKSYGPRIIDVLLELETKDTLKPNVKKNIPKIIAAFKNQSAIHILFRILKSKSLTSRLEAARALNKIQKKNSDLIISERVLKKQILKECNYYINVLELISSIQHIINLDLVKGINDNNKNVYESRIQLIGVLSKELEKSFFIIFNLLFLLYKNKDVKLIFDAMRSDVKEAKINAIELLENFLETNLKLMVLPILEHRVNEENQYKSSILKLKLHTEINVLKKLMKISGSTIRHYTVSYIKTANNVDFIPALLPLKKYRSKAVGQLAYDTYHQLLKNKD